MPRLAPMTQFLVMTNQEAEAFGVVAERFSGFLEGTRDAPTLSRMRDQLTKAEPVQRVLARQIIGGSAQLESHTDMPAALKTAPADFGVDFAGPTIDAMRAAIARAEKAIT